MQANVQFILNRGIRKNIKKKYTVFILCVIALFVNLRIGKCQIESMIWEDTGMLITDSYCTQSQDILICSISSDLDIPICKTIYQNEYEQSPQTGAMQFYSELLCYEYDGDLKWRKRFNENGENLHALKICGELMDGSIAVRNIEIGGKTSAKDEIFLIDDTGELIPVDAKLQELFKNNKTWIKGEKIFTQGLEDLHSFSLWYLDEENVPHEAWNNSETDVRGIWGNGVVWEDNSIIVYGINLSEQDKLHGAACMFDLAGHLQWKYVDEREKSSVGHAFFQSDGIMISLRHLSNPENDYSWRLLNPVDGTIVDEGLRKFDVRNTVVNEANNLHLQYSYCDEGFWLDWMKAGSEEERIRIFPEAVVDMINIDPRIMKMNEDLYLMVYSGDHRQKGGKDWCMAIWIQ